MVNLYNYKRSYMEGTYNSQPAYVDYKEVYNGGVNAGVVTGITNYGCTGYGDQVLQRFNLYAWDLESEEITITAIFDGKRGSHTEQYTRVIRTLDISNSSVLTPTNGGNLLALANTYKDVYFGGQTQTAASLMDYMNEIYGDHAGYFYESSTGGNLFEGRDWVRTVSASLVEWEAAPNAVYTFDPNNDLTFSRGTIITPDDIHNVNALRAFLCFGDRLSPTDLKFDIYIDGTKDPNITVLWSVVRSDDTFSLQTVTPQVYVHPLDFVGALEHPSLIQNEDNVWVPNDSEWWVVKHNYTWPGSYAVPYLREFDQITADLNTLEKIILYGIDGIANGMHYYLRFQQQVNINNEGMMTWGDLIDIFVPEKIEDQTDVTARRIDDSNWNNLFGTLFEVHFGKPPMDTDDDTDDYPEGYDGEGGPGGVYPSPDGTPDFSGGTPTGFPGNAILTTTYSMDALTLDNVGSKLWSQSYLDVLKVQSNPIENIVSCKWFPFSVTGANKSIVVGDVDFEINASKVNSIYRFTIGSVTVPKKYSSFLDCSPFTTMKLHLPYCGVVQLDASEMWGRKITVDYVIDLVSGDTLAMIFLDRTTNKPGVPYLSVSGTCGVDIPLTSTNRLQAEMKAASTTLSAVVGASGQLMGNDIMGAAQTVGGALTNLAGMDFTSQRSSNHSSACQSFNNRYAYIEYSRPALDDNIYDSGGYASRHGFPCHKFTKLTNLCSATQPKRYYFVKCDSRTKVDFAMTGEENRMLEQLLVEGIYIRPIPAVSE